MASPDMYEDFGESLTLPVEEEEPVAAAAAAAPAQEEGHGEEASATSMSKRWMTTIFNDDWEPAGLRATNKIAYACWGYERAPSTGRWHWHIYLRLNTRARMSTVKNILEENTAHIELCKGTEEHCRKYCWKEGATLTGEIGEFKADEGKQGKRSDLEDVAEMICKRGAKPEDVAHKYPVTYIRNFRGIAELHKAIKPAPPQQREVQVLVLWGPTGTGKTHRARMAYPDLYEVTMGRNPWDGYVDQTTILFDEWRPQDWPITDMNRYLDRWPVTLPARYNNRSAAWTRVIICTNCAPSTFYNDADTCLERNPMLLAAFRRRMGTSCRLVEHREDQGGPSITEIIESPPNPDMTPN